MEWSTSFSSMTASSGTLQNMEIFWRNSDREQPADQLIHPLALQHERHFVNGMVNVFFLDDRFERHVAEHGNFLAQFLVKRLLATPDEDVRHDADFAQLGDGLLRRFRFQFAGSLDVRNVGDVQKNCVVVAHFQREFADGFEKRQPFDVAGGAADFRDDDVSLGFFGENMDAVFDFVRDVRNDLHRLAEIFSFALVVQHGLINLAAREIVQPRQLDVREALVMAEVEVGLRAVVEHINFAVLIRRHRAGIHIEIRVELLQRALEAAIFEQRAERGGRQAFAERTHHAASYEDKFHFKKYLITNFIALDIDVDVH